MHRILINDVSQLLNKMANLPWSIYQWDFIRDINISTNELISEYNKWKSEIIEANKDIVVKYLSDKEINIDNIPEEDKEKTLEVLKQIKDYDNWNSPSKSYNMPSWLLSSLSLNDLALLYVAFDESNFSEFDIKSLQILESIKDTFMEATKK